MSLCPTDIMHNIFKAVYRFSCASRAGKHNLKQRQALHNLQETTKLCYDIPNIRLTTCTLFQPSARHKLISTKRILRINIFFLRNSNLHTFQILQPILCIKVYGNMFLHFLYYFYIFRLPFMKVTSRYVSNQLMISFEL